MSAIDHLVRANERFVASSSGDLPAAPKLALAVLTCMDCRLDVLGALGLGIGDAHIIRNAGGIPTDDALRSVAISQRHLGTREIMIIHHTGCGMDGFDDDGFRHTLTAESGQPPPWHVPGFTDLVGDTVAATELVRNCPWIPHRDTVRGFVWDVSSARLTEV